MAGLGKGEIISNCCLGGPYWEMTAYLPMVAAEARPGQFVHVRCSDGPWPLLRRPFSLFAVDREAGEIRLLYQVKGVGTLALTRKRPGEELDVIGPLGHGFPLEPGLRNVWLVAGGMGMVPLYFLAREAVASGVTCSVFLGAATAGGLLHLELWEDVATGFAVATEDGTYGYKGVVTDLVEAALQREKPGVIYACGPVGMVRRLALAAATAGAAGYASLESRMACGVGACQGCAVRFKDGGYRLVCRDGPVFSLDMLEGEPTDP